MENYVLNYKNFLENEIKEREEMIKTIDNFLNLCQSFFQKNKEYVSEDFDDIRKLKETLKNMNNCILKNCDDIDNIIVSKKSLEKVKSIQSEDIIEELDKNINLIKEKNQNIQDEVDSIKETLDDFLNIKIKCPYCNNNSTTCHICNGTHIVTFENLYFGKKEELYTKNNKYISSISQQSIDTEVNTETNVEKSSNIDNNYKSFDSMFSEKYPSYNDTEEKKSKNTRFVLTREN